MKKAFQEFLKTLGENPDRADLKDTPDRWMKAMEFFTSGSKETLEKVIDGILINAESSDMVIVRDIEFYSLCEHHLLPFFGTVHIGYIPKKSLIGLSKMPRIVDHFARRLQNQERLGSQIADAMKKALDPEGVGVVVEAEHFCMKMRGVQKERNIVTTSHFRGSIEVDPQAKNLFLQLIRDPKG